MESDQVVAMLVLLIPLSWVVVLAVTVAWLRSAFFGSHRAGPPPYAWWIPSAIALMFALLSLPLVAMSINVVDTSHALREGSPSLARSNPGRWGRRRQLHVDLGGSGRLAWCAAGSATRNRRHGFHFPVRVDPGDRGPSDSARPLGRTFRDGRLLHRWLSGRDRFIGPGEWSACGSLLRLGPLAGARVGRSLGRRCGRLDRDRPLH
jgi:hypothetical protein